MHQKMILVVDDEPDFVHSVSARLEFDGFAVVTAGDGITGLETVMREHPDLILLDIMMPGMDGLEFFRRLRKEPAGATIPVIFISVRTEFFNDPTINSDPRTRILRKPFELDNLIQMIRESLAAAQLG